MVEDKSIGRFLTETHNEWWFSIVDPEKPHTMDNVELTKLGKEKGYELPSQQEYEDWKTQQETQQKEAEVIQKRKAEYGTNGEQLERIIEAIAAGDTPTQALKAETKRVKDIKQKYPKP